MFSNSKAQIIRGDARWMTEIEAQSVDLIVTSPPYWQIKDYGADAQIGFGQSLHEYLFDLARVWAESFRVLKAGRRLCVNIGDQFARTSVYGRYKVIPLHAEVIAAAQACGFDCLGSIIWQKKTTMNTSGGAVIMGSFPHPPNGVVELDYEHILLFKKPGETPKTDAEIKAASALSKEEWKTYFAGHWHFGGARQIGHEATFPEALPRRLIRMFSFVGDTVLDPFLGSGTTAKVALELGRNAVGYELNPDYLTLIREKLCPAQAAFDAPQVAFQEAERGKIAPAPPQYRPHVEDAKPLCDAQEERAQRESEPTFKVCEIGDDCTVQLDSGQKISLLGIQIPPQHREKACAYLQRFVRGKKVLVRRDASLGEANEAVYLLLANKLFVNRKMIEMGLALPDASISHKHREKFLAAASKSRA